MLPISFGKVYELQPSGDNARRVNGDVNQAVSMQRTISNKARTVNEIPIAGPLTSAISGLENSINPRTYFLLLLSRKLILDVIITVKFK